MLFAFAAVALAMLSGFIVYRSVAAGMPDIEEALARQAAGGTKILDRNGNLLYQFGDPAAGLRNPVTWEQIGGRDAYIVQATVSTEDASFFTNPGVNFKGLARAFVENLLGREGFLSGSGGSSITQQLVKNVFIDPNERSDRSVSRKMKEMVYAVELNKRYSKEQILTWYLNLIFYGNNAYGIQSAAQTYFGKDVADLDLAEAAMLAGIPNAPAIYDPYGGRAALAAAKARQAEVLDLMATHGYVTRADADAAKAEKLTFRNRNEATGPAAVLRAPHFVFYVRDELVKLFGEEALYTGGMVVTTTLDVNLQEQAQQILNDRIQYFDSQFSCGCNNGSVVTIDPKTGQILVMLGSRDFNDDSIQGQVNNAVAIKQPGSSFKPIVYLADFIYRGHNPESLVSDEPYAPGGVQIIDPEPVNASELPIKTALGSSLNIPAARTANDVGIDNVVTTANKMGYTTMSQEDVQNGQYGPAIAVGGANVTLLEQSLAYATLANNGDMIGVPALEDYGSGMRTIDPVSILKVADKDGKMVYRAERTDEQVVPAADAWDITSILSNCKNRYLIWACGSTLDLADGRPSAVKTGTQQGYEDISQIIGTWAMGYTPDLVTGVWIGNADNAPLGNITSATTASDAWNHIMVMEHQALNIPAHDFVRPEDAQDATPVSTATEAPTQEQQPATAVITSPERGAILDGTVTVTGTASAANLEGWTLEFAPAGTEDYSTIADGDNSVEAGDLGQWDVADLEPAVYTLRLRVKAEGQDEVSTQVPVRVKAPTETPTEEPTETPTEEPTETPTPQPTESATPEPSRTPTPTDTPTETATPSPTQTVTPVPTDTATATPEPTKTPKPTRTPRGAETPTPTP